MASPLKRRKKSFKDVRNPIYNDTVWAKRVKIAKLKKKKNATNNVVENSPGHQKDDVLYGNNEGTVFDHKVLWLLFYGTVKAYHNLEVVFTLTRMTVLPDCVLEHYARGSCTKCSPTSLLLFLRMEQRHNHSAETEAMWRNGGLGMQGHTALDALQS